MSFVGFWGNTIPKGFGLFFLLPIGFLMGFYVFFLAQNWLKHLLRRCFGVVLGVKPLLRRYLDP